uniref:zinc finger and BTB domain-containing protein 7A-like n=1 Tax=Myxine glutinosa TaxID=7769 RepID=UPI00358FC5CF
MAVVDNGLIGIPFPEHGNNMLCSLNEQRQAGLLCDGIVVCAGGQEFPIHRALLASCSGFFRRAFTDEMLPRTRMHIDGICSDTFAALLEFVYTATVTVSPNSLRRLLDAARFLEFTQVAEVCADVLRESGEALRNSQIPSPDSDCSGNVPSQKYWSCNGSSSGRASPDNSEVSNVQGRALEGPEAQQEAHEIEYSLKDDNVDEESSAANVSGMVVGGKHLHFGTPHGEKQDDDAADHLFSPTYNYLQPERHEFDCHRTHVKNGAAVIDLSRAHFGLFHSDEGRNLESTVEKSGPFMEGLQADHRHTGLTTHGWGYLSTPPDSLRRPRSRQAFQQCPICHKVIRGAGKLPRHIRTHTGERPYACPRCSVRFTRQDKLKLHLKKQDCERPTHRRHSAQKQATVCPTEKSITTDML